MGASPFLLIRSVRNTIETDISNDFWGLIFESKETKKSEMWEICGKYLGYCLTFHCYCLQYEKIQSIDKQENYGTWQKPKEVIKVPAGSPKEAISIREVAFFIC